MKIYKYWVTEKQKILIEGMEQEITCYGGSNSSTGDARLNAREKAEKIQRKIKGEKHLFDEYEAEIREEILQIIDDHSAQGARVIVLGRNFDPRDRETKKMMDGFNCDPLYTRLCLKQGCYRARLTPKPYRMKMQAYKVRFPGNGHDPEFRQ